MSWDRKKQINDKMFDMEQDKKNKMQQNKSHHKIKTKKALLTHSCTAALEITSHLMNLNPGDEVIMPSYTFVSTANAFALRGCIPVFVDIREDTLNIDESLIDQAVTDKTKALVVVHYAGVSCEMDKILKIAKDHNFFVIVLLYNVQMERNDEIPIEILKT